MFGLKFWLGMFKITSVSGAPPQTPLGSLRRSPRLPSREELLAFGNRSFAPSALNPRVAPQNKKFLTLLAFKHKIPPVPCSPLSSPDGLASVSELIHSPYP